MKITGTVVYEDLEGGFWGIDGDDGEQYFPVEGLPDDLRERGVRIAAEAEPVRVMTTVMWGRNVRLTDVRRL